MLDVGNLSASYGPSRVLHDLTFACGKGEIVCLLGRNGVGKTTTLKAIMGLIPDASGTVRFDGHSVLGRPPHAVARAGIGYVPEARLIFPDLTVAENLSIGSWRGRRRQDNRLPDRVLDTFPRLAGKLRQKGGTLSGGEQQMLAVGRALMGEPRLVLVDEPTEGLAPVLVEALQTTLAAIAHDGTALLIAESRFVAARKAAHRIVVLSKGTVMFIGPPDALDADPTTRRQYLEV